LSSSIDERIVEMTFKGDTFISGVKNALTALQQLKDGLNLKGATDSLTELDDAGKKFSLSGMASALDGISSKFSALGIAGVTVLTNLVNKAVDAGLELAKSLTIEPILDGLSNYETKINSIQTILANTQSQGTNLNQVTAALDQLNQYANLTVYNFADMTKNIGTFTAAGVDLNTSVSSIKGIANLAALSGSSADQASTAMYQLSQAIAAGSVKLQDWNSVVNAGFGGKVFQNALIQTASVHDKTVQSMIDKEGGFRNSLQSGWLTAKVLTDTLNTFTGDMSKNQLIAYGYTSQEADAIIKQAQAAVNSATQIRTVTQLMQALKEEVGSAWSKVWEAVIGNIGQATGTLTAVHNTLENLFTTPVLDLAKFLDQWNQLGGRAAVIQGFVNAFKALGDIIAPIKEAFRDIFPPASVSTAVAMSKAFEQLTADLIPSKQTVSEIRDIFIGLFSAVKIVVDVVGDVIKGFTGVGSSVKDAGSGILGTVAYLLNYVNALLQVVDGNTKLENILKDVGKVLASPITILGDLIGSFGSLGNMIDAVYQKIQPFLSEVGGEFKNLSKAIADSIQSGGFAQVEQVINEGLFGTILLAIRKWISNLGGGGGGGLLDTIKESFEGLTGALQAMQTNLKSGTLEKIAISVGILAASLLVLSTINVKDLTKSLSAMTVTFTELIAAMAVVTKISGSAGIIKLPIVAASLILLSTAILILAAAVAIFAQFSWDQLAKGLSAVAVLLTELVVAISLMSKNITGVYSAAVAMEAMAVALNIMAAAVAKLGGLDWATLGKGLGSLAILFTMIAVFQKFSEGSAGMIAGAAAMVIVGAALNIMAQAIKTLGDIPLGDLAKGIVAMAAALLIVAVALDAMEAGLPGAAALIVAAGALVLLANALNEMGSMSWEDVAKALVLLAGSLVLIAAALIVMEASLPGAAALIVAAGALAILAPVMIALGGLSWEAIAKGLVAMAGAFVIIGVAGVALVPAIPGLLGLGAAIALIGVGILAAGAGVALFATGLAALAVALAATGAAIAAFVGTVAGTLPTLATTLTATITSFANGIAKAAPAIVNALSAVLTSLLNAIIKDTPTLVKAFETILTNMIQIMTTDAPKLVSGIATMVVNILTALTSKVPSFVAAGTALIVAILNGINANISKVVAAATNIVVTFITNIGAANLKITQAGINMIINFINGLAKQINTATPQLRAAGLNLASAIINGMTGGLLGGSTSIENAAISIASTALNAAKSFLGIKSPSKRFHDEVGVQSALGVATGFDDTAGIVGDSAANVGKTALDSVKKSLSGLNDAVNSNIDLQPKITPVLDLTEAQNGFATLAGMSKDQLLNTNSTFVKAASISADNAAAAAAIGADGTSGTKLEFNQYNTSPKALSAAEIYRQTKNQLSVVEEALPA
jgi:tape measure domain-containing protein